MHRDSELDCKYDGAVAYSLETIKLIELGMKVKENKKSGRKTSNDIINVRYNWKVKSAKEIMKIIDKKIKSINKELDESKEFTEEEVNTKLDYISSMKSKRYEIATMENWDEVKSGDLRTLFYEEGFVIDGIQYVFYGRSGSKSRTGQALFIKKTLAKRMILWTRMGVKKLTKKNLGIDLAGVLAYEKLVGSAIESIINIPTSKMLMITDVDSIFEKECNVVRTNSETGFLDSFVERAKIKNSLFDGQLLLDCKYFKNGKSMKLLRNHFFKSAGFNTNIQLALRNLCPEGVDYDTWELEDMFGNKILAKDIEVIMTPTSLKALKFSKFVGNGTESDMYDYWRNLVESEGCRFGVVKHEKSSKRGENLQQTSYQMINSMPLTREDISELTVYEKEYIEKLKNDDEFFVKYLRKDMDIMNSNEVFAEMYKLNPDVANTKIFKDYRKSKIKSFVQHVKKGKIRLNGDYVVMVGNAYEELLHAVGMLPVKDGILDNSYVGILRDNEICTKLFNDGIELTGFRNPHTSPSNVLIAMNKRLDLISKYFNFNKNIVVVNAINFELQDILSGCDYDSDTLLLLHHRVLLKRAKECFERYMVCINAVESEKVSYKLTNSDMATIDNKLSKSQRLIGEVVNLGQESMSNYWDSISRDASEEDIRVLLKEIDVMTVLSGICIDLAKKFYAIDIEKEVKNVRSIDQIDDLKPKFWTYVSSANIPKNKMRFFETPMDYLMSEMSALKYANQRPTIEFSSIMNKSSSKVSNHRQVKKLIDYVNDLNGRLVEIKMNKNLTRDQSYDRSVNTIKYYGYELNKIDIKESTMHALLLLTTSNDESISQSTALMLKVLFENGKKSFVKTLKKA